MNEKDFVANLRILRASLSTDSRNLLDPWRTKQILWTIPSFLHLANDRRNLILLPVLRTQSSKPAAYMDALLRGVGFEIIQISLELRAGNWRSRASGGVRLLLCKFKKSAVMRPETRNRAFFPRTRLPTIYHRRMGRGKMIESSQRWTGAAPLWEIWTDAYSPRGEWENGTYWTCHVPPTCITFLFSITFMQHAQISGDQDLEYIRILALLRNSAHVVLGVQERFLTERNYSENCCLKVLRTNLGHVLQKWRILFSLFAIFSKQLSSDERSLISTKGSNIFCFLQQCNRLIPLLTFHVNSLKTNVFSNLEVKSHVRFSKQKQESSS